MLLLVTLCPLFLKSEGAQSFKLGVIVVYLPPREPRLLLYTGQILIALVEELFVADLNQVDWRLLMQLLFIIFHIYTVLVIILRHSRRRSSSYLIISQKIMGLTHIFG